MFFLRVQNRGQATNRVRWIVQDALQRNQLEMTSRTMERRGQGKKRIDDYNEQENDRIASLLSPGQWFMFPKALILILDAEQALMLAVLIGASERVKARSRRNGCMQGWFYYRISQCQRDLRFDRFKQARILKILKANGFVEHCRRGLPAKRYFRIRFDKIHSAIQKIE